MSDVADGGQDDEDLALGTIFIDPPRPPSPEPTIAVYHNIDIANNIANEDDYHPWSTISVRLVGSHPLWGHYLWNAARALAGFLQRTPKLYAGRTVLELGAGGGLPGLVAAKCGARKVVLTDYPDQALVDNMAYNVVQNVEPARRGAVCVLGYVWGHPVEPLLLLLAPRPDATTAYCAHAGADGCPSTTFDLILLSDLIFNHSQHRALLTTCERAIAPGGCVLVFYTHHRPHLAQRDMDFFDMARKSGWECEKVLTERFPPMFPEDSGEEEVRSTVHGWRLTRV
ncbi:hypothetical protein BJV74DRAFT_827878 [Russula compacta]|nr:hypothetical protein BJV74DRAFT_827878 [Russula compacta]